MIEDFGLANLPFGSFRRGPREPPRLCVALGDDAIELASLAPLLEGVAPEHVEAANLDLLLAAAPSAWAQLRRALQELLAAGAPDEARIPLSDAIPSLPFTVGDYVDFFSSLEHATNVGRLFRPNADPLPPNWRHLPVGYHGRSSTVVVSGTPIRRPVGQRPGPSGPTWGTTEQLDIEVELGFVTGGLLNELGEPIPIDDAGEHIFGFVIVNDWSARDLQRWESQPLGPFLGKSFATSISPWVVPLPALEPHRVPGPVQDPRPLEYLLTDEPWGLDVDLEVTIQPAGGERVLVARTNARNLYWTPAQQLAHVSSNGATVRPGDLYASGTISGAEQGSQGSLIELTAGGTRPLDLEGVERTFLEDGDVVTITAWAGSGAGDTRIGFGEVRGEVVGEVRGEVVGVVGA